MLAKNNLTIKIILSISILSLISAYVIEYLLGFKPCNLCLISRYPYIIAIIFILFNLLIYDLKKYNFLFLLILFFFASIISVYHVGIENNIFEEGLLCDVGRIESTNTTDLLKSLKDMPISCKEVTFKIFGLSLATFNTLLNFFLVSILIYKLKHYGKN